MANTRISDLTASASNLASTDLAPVVQTVGVGPVKMTGLQLAGGLLGSTTFNGSTVTTSSPVLNLTQTWNAGAVTFTGLKFNATDTASASGSLLLDIGTGGGTYVSKFNVDKSGNVTTENVTARRFIGINTNITVSDQDSRLILSAGSTIQWTSGSTGSTADTTLRRADTATLQLGAADTTGTTAPTAQFLRVQSWSSSTNNDQTGANFTIQGSRGTGAGAGGSIIFQVAPAGGSSNGVQNGYSTALTIDSAKKITTYGSIDNSTGSATALQYSAGASQPCFGFGTAAAGFGIYGGLNAGYLYGPTYGGATGFGVSSTGALGFCVSTFPGTGMDVTLFRDAANTLALRNGTAAQLFRVYSTYNGTNDAYGAIGAAVNLDGTSGDANTLYIGSQKKGSPTALTKLAIQVDGTTRLDYGVTNSGEWYTGSNFKVNGTSWGVTALLVGSSASAIKSSADGVIGVFNNAGTDFSRFQFGGTTSSFPALKRVSANIQVIAADGTSSAGLIVGNQALATTATDGFLYIPTCAGTPTGTPTTQTGTAPLVVDSTNNKLYVYVGGAWTAMN